MNSKWGLGVIDLVRNPTRQKLVQWAVDHCDDDSWIIKGDLTNEIDASPESVRKNINPMIKYGVFEIKNPDAQIKHYRVDDTPVTDILCSWDYYSPLKLLGTTVRQDVVEFYLDMADPDEGYSKGQIERKADVSRYGLNKKGVIEDLVECGFLREVEGTRATNYQLNSDSPLPDAIRRLNEAVIEQDKIRESP